MRINQELDTDDRELIRRLEPIYQRNREQAKLEGMQEGERLVVENLLQFRFGTLDEELSGIIEPILALPPSEFTPLLMQFPATPVPFNQAVLLYSLMSEKSKAIASSKTVTGAIAISRYPKLFIYLFFYLLY